VLRDLRLRGASAGGFAGVTARIGGEEVGAHALPSAAPFEDDVKTVDQVFTTHDRSSMPGRFHGSFAQPRCSFAQYAPARIDSNTQQRVFARPSRKAILESRKSEQEKVLSTRSHTMVWIDHREAKVFHFDAEHHEEVRVRNSHTHQNLHHKANAGDSGHVAIDKEFLHRVVAELASAEAILIVGPGSAKTELNAYARQSRPEVAARIRAVQPIDHPSDGQLLAHGRKFFVADDRMRLQVPSPIGTPPPPA